MPDRRFEINEYGEIIERTEEREDSTSRSGDHRSASWRLGPLSLIYNLIKDGSILAAILSAPLVLPFVLYIGFIIATAVGVLLIALYVIVGLILLQFGIDISFIAEFFVQ